MENAVNALKMAAAVLIFIIAIGTSFSVFGTAKRTADSIIGMRNKQQYLEAADLEKILYTSSNEIQTGVQYENSLTTNGDRIVGINDLYSTICRYSKEKYGVTIMNSEGIVIARFDTATETIINTLKGENLEQYKEKLSEFTRTTYVQTPNFNGLQNFYQITSEGVTTYGAPWLGTQEEIQKRINAEMSGSVYIYNGKTHQGIGLLETLSKSKIIEVTNEIDESRYLEDANNTTDLLQQYQMPTVEIVYILS